jgi:hypothetical protein
VVAALGALEISFLIMVGGMSAVAGLFTLFLLLQSFRNPARRWQQKARR